MLHAFTYVAKVQKFLNWGLAGFYRVFTHKSKKFWIWGVPVLKQFFHKILHTNPAPPTTYRRGLARPSAPTAREPVPS